MSAPSPEILTYRLDELVDISRLQGLAERLYTASGYPVGILDPEGEILVGAGWQDICVHFHRKHAETEKRCHQSDQYIQQHLDADGPIAYKCKNGLWDIAMPILIEDEILATLFIGQFFYEGETPDRDFFRRQAEEFGFDTDAYLKALDDVPYFTRQQIDDILRYYAGLVQLLVDIGLARKRELEAQRALRASEERFRAIFENVGVGIALTDVHGQWLHCNPRCCEMLGYSEEELRETTTKALTHPEDQSVSRTHLQQVLRGEKDSFRSEKRYIRKDGSHVWVDLAVTAIRDDQGQVTGFMGTSTDITELKRTQEALRNRNAELENVLQSISDAVVYTDMEHRIMLVNPAFETMFGYVWGDIIGQPVEHLALGIGEVPGLWDTDTPGASEASDVHELSCRRSNTSHFPAELLRSVVRDAAGTPTGYLILLRDITERKQTETALHDSEGRYRRLFDDAVLGIFRSTVDGKLLEVNPACARMFGYDSPEEIIRNVSNIATDLYVTPPTRDNIVEKLQESGDSLVMENRYLRKDGSAFTGNLHVWAVRDEAGNMQFLEGFVEDITRRKETEQALRDSEELFQAFMDNNPAITFMKDADGRHVYANKALREYLASQSISEPLGKTNEELYPQDLAREYTRTDRKVLSQNRPLTQQENVPGQDGKDRWWESVKFPIQRGNTSRYVGGFTLDITDKIISEQHRSELEQRIQQIQTFESLGILAGGIAHDFNNLLMAILGNADLGIIDHPEPQTREIFEEIKQAAQRAAKLSNQMLHYSGKGHFVLELASLNDLIRSMKPLLEESLSQLIELRLDLADDLLPVQADVDQIRQVILNLLNNASEAIGEKPGMVTLRTSCRQIERDFFDGTYLQEPLPSGRYVCLEVSDDGCGMDKRTQKRVFDPFFTTKFTGRGLGLAATLGIVRGHHGAIRVHSTPGTGSSFMVVFPATVDTGEPEFPEEVPTDTDQIAGTVLVVDDEPTVLNVLENMIRQIGCECIPCSHGQEALELFSSQPDRFDLVLLDLAMPVVPGDVVASRMREIRPDVPIVLCSGFSRTEALRRFSDKGLAGFLQKPIDIEALRKTLKPFLPANA